jgi:LysM repeat protein
MVSNCNSFYLVKSGDQCGSIASSFGITLANFYAWNPAVGNTCAGLIAADYVCVNIVGGTTLTSSTSSTPTNGITTPTPIQTGVVSNCNTFYLVQPGDQCGTVVSSHGVTLANFYLWNPAVGSTCNGLIAGDYVCVNIIGGTTLTTITTNTPTNGITTPTPIQTGMTSSCNTFYLVQPGDQCGTVASSHGVSLANFYLWNPAVGSTCAGLIAGDYVCVNVIGGSTISTTTSKSSTPTNGITTPTPIQTGMTSSCNTFYLVQSGDECGTIASIHGVSLANFYLWNPAVGNSCAGLQAGEYVCVNVIGGTTTTASKTTSTVGNGISTPTPTQSGMTGSCKTFHFVVSGDECGTIASNAGITLTQFYAWNPSVGTSCQFLDTGFYVCIASL